MNDSNVTPYVPPPPPPPAPAAQDGTVWFKEIVTALLTVAVFIALIVTYQQLRGMPDLRTYPTVTDAEEKRRLMDANESNVELIASALLGIFGAFVGYYSGRLPAEKAAAAANTNAAQAQQMAVSSVAEATGLRQKVAVRQMEAAHAADLMDQAAATLDPQMRDMHPESAAPSGDARASLASALTRHAQRLRS